MEVTSQLREPILLPCPGRDDLAHLKDDRCQPVRCTRQPDLTGLDCCQTWKVSPNVWTNEIVRVDQLNPEKFMYDQYRYQVYAKPRNLTPENFNTVHHVPDKQYVAPTTDIRALRQTMYMPVLPHNPRGVSDYTFPMTPQTMGEPDVTTACCVPVIPGNPGFQNLTQSVRPDPNLMCQTYNKCKQPQQIGPRRVNIDSEMLRTKAPPAYESYHATNPPPQFFATPENFNREYQAGPQLFQEPPRPYAVPYPQQLQAPQYIDAPSGGHDGCAHYDAYSLGIDVMNDGVNPKPGPGAAFTSVKSLKYQDRVNRCIQSHAETLDERVKRLKSMYGAFGSYLVATPYTRRFLEGTKDTIAIQGHGFNWNYPKHDNRLCYVVERNPRC